MASSFEFNTHATIVFPFFQTHSLFQYLFALLFLFGCGMGREYLTSYRRKILFTSDRSNLNAFRTTAAMLLVLVYSVDMCLMLAIMTYNIGIFMAIVSGVGVGHYYHFDHSLQAGYQKVAADQDEDMKVSTCC
jgi:copper transporter 1|tara:strand:- start:229 stop:627 length:399 start_codon:yes stop_codon:yes gene_type:complete